MSKENSENTLNLKRKYSDSKEESSDSEDIDERPNEFFRNVLSEIVISSNKTPKKGSSPGSRKSSSPSTSANKVHDSQSICDASSSKRRQSATSPLNCTNTGSEDGVGLNRISEEINNTSPAAESINADSTTVEFRPLEVCSSDDLALNYSTKSGANNPNEPSNLIDPLQGTSSAHFQDSPLVFVASTLFENEISSNPMEIEHVDVAADVLISDSSIQGSPKQVPTSVESEDSENENIFSGSFQLENASSPQEFCTPVELMIEIRTVFALISKYVNSEITKNPSKIETIEINLPPRRPRRRFVWSRKIQLEKTDTTRAQALASHLLTTITEQERQQDTYHGSWERFVQMSISGATQESSLSCGHESYGVSSGGPCQSSGRPPQSSVGLNIPMGENAQEPPFTLEQRDIIFLAQGYSIGLEIGSEGYIHTISGRALQGSLSLMVEENTEEFTQDLLNLASEVISLRFPKTLSWLNSLSPVEVRQLFYTGVIQGFTHAYSMWSPRRHYSCTLPPGGIVHGPLAARFFAQSRLTGFPCRSIPRRPRSIPRVVFRSFVHRTYPGFPIGYPRTYVQSYLLSFSRTPKRTSQRNGRGSNPGRPPRPSQYVPRRPNRGSGSERSAINIEKRLHQILTLLVLDLNMIRTLADLILKEFTNTDNYEKSYENISNYLLCFEIMREDYRERENCIVVLEQEVSSDIEHCRNEAYVILHMRILTEVLENCIPRVQYGAFLIKAHKNLSEVRCISSHIRELARRAMSYEYWTKEK